MVEWRRLMEKKSLYLLDGMALAYRAHFAFVQRPILTSKGLNASAPFGFTSTLVDLIQRRRPDFMAVVFDTDAPTERHKTFEAYKANRQEMPEGLSAALPFIRKLVEAFRIPVISLDGYEADDLIGTLAVKAAAVGLEVFMVTPDKDFGQLVSNSIKILKPGYRGGEEEILGPEEVCARWEIARPELVKDMLGLCGDSSDNIPGIPGVGPKTAAKLIQEHGTVEGLLANVASVKGKLREKIEAGAENALLSKSLATIQIDSPIELQIDTLILSEPDREKLAALFDELEFRSMKKRVLGIQDNEAQAEGATEAPAETEAVIQTDLFESTTYKTIADVPHVYRELRAPEDIDLLASELSRLKEFCFDFETTSLDPLTARPLGIAFSWNAGEAIYLHLPASVEEARESLQKLAPIFENPAIGKIGQNLKFDISILLNAGVAVRGDLFDTMLAHALVEPESRHGMDYLATTLLGYSPIPFEKVAPIEEGELALARIDPAALAEYAAEDADVTWQLREKLAPMVLDRQQEKVFHEIEAPLISVLARMELAGIRVDSSALKEIGKSLATHIQSAEEAIFEMAGRRFQIGSPKQLGVVLFDELKLADKPKKTATGQYSTSEQTLQSFHGRHPIIARILDYREALKLKNTYVDTLPEAIHPKTGRVHTSFAQLHTSTGRLASSHPNLQNIPVRSELGREIRRAFVPGNEQQVLLSADYSQIELRIIAALSGDEGLRLAFEQKLDIHTATAAKIYDVPHESVTREMRAKAKMVNFGIPYGISAFGLAQRLGSTRTEAMDLINSYFNRFPGVREYIDRTLVEARKRGYVETVSGRRRVIRDITSANATTRTAAERNAVNMPIQGTAADMIKLAMIRVDKCLTASQIPARMLLQVHDELLFEVDEAAVDALTELVSREMIAALTLQVPIEVDTGTGKNWLDAH